MAETIIPRKHGPGNPRNDLTAEYVRSILDYDTDTGLLRWRWREDVGKNVNARDAGKIAGGLLGGYVVIRVVS